MERNNHTEFVDPITWTETPLLIIAGPGAGKTYTLVERVVHLVKQGVDADRIMVATFTEKAAKELITRVSAKLLELDLKVNLNEMYIGTLHSIFLRILEEHREFTRLKRNYRVLDAFDQKYFVFRNMKEFLAVENSELLIGKAKGAKWYKAGRVIQHVSTMSEECLDEEELMRSETPAIRVMGEYQKIYQRLLSEENCLDFSNIQTEVLFLLESQEAILLDLQNKIEYMMVDEYQDTNTIQEKILLLLAAKHKRICVVGDDDQGLYRFRGATIRNILEFADNFVEGECKYSRLTRNYRSHPDIINFYNRWMEECDWESDGQEFRFRKRIIPRDFEFTANPCVIKVSAGGSRENYFNEVYEFIKELEDTGRISDHNQIAFLFQSVKNENVQALANYLEEKGIKIFSPRSALFFDREEIRLLLGALIFIFPNLFEHLKWRDDAKLEVWDRYEQWKSDFANAVRSNPVKHAELLIWCQKRAKEHLTLTGKTKYAFAALLYQLLEFPLYSDYLKVDLDDNKVSLRAAYNIALLSKLLFKFESIYNVSVLTRNNLEITLRMLFNNFLRFIVEGGIEEFEDFDEYAPSGCVSFMTIHQSKGLEFPIVVVDSLWSSPRRQYTETDEILQERYYSKPPFEPLENTKYYDFYRLFYTAFSRPQNLLVLSCHERKKKNGDPLTPKKHFQNLYNELPSWRSKAFDISKLDLEKVKPINLKHEYAFTSHILLYENCPLQYKFYKELEFVEVRTGAVLGGSLLHQTIEDIHRAVLNEEVDSLTDENIENWHNLNYQLLSKQHRSYLQDSQVQALLKQVLRYRDSNADKWHRIIEAEVDVSLVKDDYILKGSIDLVEGANGTVEIVDFKSGSKPDVNSTERITRKTLERYKRQLQVYGHLVEERTGHKVSKLHLYYPKEQNASPYISFQFDEAQVEQTIESFDRVVTTIEEKDFYLDDANKSEKLCGDCDMRFHCNPRVY